MTKGRLLECCGFEITVEHLLTKCKKYEELRKKYGLPENLQILLGPKYPKNKIVGYLNKANLINEFSFL